MAEIKGVIEKILDKESKNGDKYVAIKLKGLNQYYYDWKEHYKKAEVKAGDSVVLEYGEGKFSRINSLVKTADGKQEETIKDRQYYDTDRQIARATALKCATEILKDNECYCEPNHVIALSEIFEHWLLR